MVIVCLCNLSAPNAIAAKKCTHETYQRQGESNDLGEGQIRHRHELDLNYFYSCDRAKNAKKIEPRDASRTPPIDSSRVTKSECETRVTGIWE